ARVADQLRAIGKLIDDASAATSRSAAARAIADGLAAVHALRTDITNWTMSADERFELDRRLEQKERQFDQAYLVAASIQIDATADDAVVTPGQTVRVKVTIANRGD